MKKLIALVSGLAASFIGTAQADITMSAGQSLEVQSVGSQTNLAIGGSLGFAFSQDLGNGVTVSMQGLSFGNDVAVADNISTGTVTQTTGTINASKITGGTLVNMGVTANIVNSTNVGLTALTASTRTETVDSDAFEQISFATANGTLTYGSDVEIDYADLGVGDVLSSDLTDTGLGTSSSAISLGNTTGNGIQYATSFGGSSITIGYLLSNSSGADKFDTSASSLDNTMAFKTAIPVGPLSATIGYTADNSTAESHTSIGISTSMAVGNGTLSASYVSVDATNDETEAGVAFSGTVGTATLKAGYQTADVDGSDNTSTTTLSMSQSVGTGASVFAEMVNKSGVASGETSAILLGSSFTF